VRSLGSVVVELRASAVVLATVGPVLVGVEASHDVVRVLAGSVFGGAVYAAILWRFSFLSLMQRTISAAQRAPHDAEFEAPRRTALRALARTTLLAVVTLLALLLLFPRTGYDAAGGILLASGPLYLAMAGRLRRWEREHGQTLLRESSRWRWAAPSSDSGSAKWWKRHWKCFVIPSDAPGPLR